MSTIAGIRAAVVSDVDDIAEIHVTCWREVYSFMPQSVHELRGPRYRRDQWQRWFRERPEGEALFVLESGRRVVGFAVAKPNTDPAIDVPGEFHACYIISDYRGGESGPLSMMALAQFLKRLGVQVQSLQAHLPGTRLHARSLSGPRDRRHRVARDWLQGHGLRRAYGSPGANAFFSAFKTWIKRILLKLLFTECRLRVFDVRE